MKKVQIHSITYENNWGETRESIEVFVDGINIGYGTYGGEPEDNVRYRTYGWVEPLILRLAKELGADVEFKLLEKDPEKDYE